MQITSGKSLEIDFRELVRQQQRAGASAPAEGASSIAVAPHAGTGNTASFAAATESAGGSVAAEKVPDVPPSSRSQRYSIIERLEKRYGGGAVLNDGDDGAPTDRRSNRRDDDDLYDSEDSFIDDSELQQNIEELHDQTKVKTKHSGFFVNAGDEIETLEREERCSLLLGCTWLWVRSFDSQRLLFRSVCVEQR